MAVPASQRGSKTNLIERLLAFERQFSAASSLLVNGELADIERVTRVFQKAHRLIESKSSICSFIYSLLKEANSFRLARFCIHHTTILLGVTHRPLEFWYERRMN